MFVFKNIFAFCLIFLITSCSLNNVKKLQKFDDYSIEIETPGDKNNRYFRENLKRLFYSKSSALNKYLVKTDITFLSTDTLSVSGTAVLKSTKAKIDFHLIDKNTNKIIKSDSIYTFPALSSSSNSLYSQQKGIDHIKDRLIKSSAKTLFMKINIIIRKLN